jgi:origin recognition complex subunit 1
LSIQFTQAYEFFDDDAILFAAKKTAALSGDVRKAFQICRVAAETVTQRFEDKEKYSDRSSPPYPKIRICDVQKASQESFNKAIVTVISYCTPLQALFLISLASLYRTTCREVGGFDVGDIMAKMRSVANASGDPQYLRPPSFSETVQLMNHLGEVR